MKTSNLIYQNGFTGIFLWLLFLTCISCKEEKVTTVPEQINLQSPTSHQENTYIRYFGFCDYFNPTTDTLLLNVVSFNIHGLQLEEKFTPESPMYLEHQDPVTYTVKWNEDYIVTTPEIRSASYLFFLFAEDTLWLKKPASVTLHQDQCRIYDDIAPFEGDAIGSIPLFEAGEEEFRQKQVITQVPVTDTLVLWDQYLVFDSHNIYASYRNIKQNIYVQSPTVSAYNLIQN